MINKINRALLTCAYPFIVVAAVTIIWLAYRNDPAFWDSTD